MRKGSHHTQDARDAVGKSSKERWKEPGYTDKIHNAEWIKNNSNAFKKRWRDPEFVMMMHSPEVIKKNSDSHKGKPHVHSLEAKKKNSKSHIELWKDPEYAKKILHRRIPSGPEQEFICISDRFYFAFDFVGDGTLVIDGKNPDFVSLKDDRKLIEIWGEYFKKGRNPKDLIDFYKVRGYECLVIYASELKHLEKIINRVREFVEN